MRTVLNRQHAVLTHLQPVLSPLPVSAIARPHAHGPAIRFCELETDVPQAFTYGWLHPTIVISQGLRDRLDGKALSAILAHEIHHAQAHDYLIQQLFLTVIKAFPWVGVKPLYAEYLTIREIRADKFATAWQQTTDHLIEAIVITLRALKLTGSQEFPSETGWNSVWQARIEALREESGKPPAEDRPISRALWVATIVPGASSAVFLATSLSIFCH
jgi:beta-lactamase regulating signal transducer with metallopeptidase domain